MGLILFSAASCYGVLNCHYEHYKFVQTIKYGYCRVVYTVLYCTQIVCTQGLYPSIMAQLEHPLVHSIRQKHQSCMWESDKTHLNVPRDLKVMNNEFDWCKTTANMLGIMLKMLIINSKNYPHKEIKHTPCALLMIFNNQFCADKAAMPFLLLLRQVILFIYAQFPLCLLDSFISILKHWQQQIPLQIIVQVYKTSCTTCLHISY